MLILWAGSCPLGGLTVNHEAVAGTVIEYGRPATDVLMLIVCGGAARPLLLPVKVNEVELGWNVGGAA